MSSKNIMTGIVVALALVLVVVVVLVKSNVFEKKETTTTTEIETVIEAGLVTLTFSATLRADVDYNAILNVRDATWIQKKLAGIV